MKLGRYKEALQDADSAIAADSAFVKGFLRRAAVNEALENFEDAVRDYEKVRPFFILSFQTTSGAYFCPASALRDSSATHQNVSAMPGHALTRPNNFSSVL